ncbi:hypothetical protein HPB49_017738 [Dermacentor silvarum]|uniref:Uncharacterized protein n=1 Tax=Dermacentor silvarum TaxID=543639 RepID=A0ACB8CMB8_DERSI|nr:hypothetical protein HPB49_017738 [Dermacentor silvarum]
MPHKDEEEQQANSAEVSCGHAVCHDRYSTLVQRGGLRATGSTSPAAYSVQSRFLRNGRIPEKGGGGVRRRRNPVVLGGDANKFLLAGVPLYACSAQKRRQSPTVRTKGAGEELSAARQPAAAASFPGDPPCTSESPPVCGHPGSGFDLPEILEPGGSGAGDECYQAAAETIISHCREKAKVMGNEISAPYEVPHFPIELYESRKVMQQQLSTRCRYVGPPLETDCHPDLVPVVDTA